MSHDIAWLRDEIAGLDRKLLEILQRRFELAEEVGRIKAKGGQPVVVREVEQRVLTRAREAAELCGVSPDVMEKIFSSIIRGAVERQHRVGVEQGARGGARMLVIGAGGSMGGWLCRFLESIGHTALGVDTAWSDHTRIDEVPDLDGLDMIFVSVPLDATEGVLNDLAKRKIDCPVVEIASIKSHLRSPLDALKTPLSLHPMFGPGKNPLEPITVVHAVLNDEVEERKQILDQLAHPYLNLVSLPFEHHDRLMGWLLGLAHLHGILFAGALARSGLDPEELERTASTTFSRQVETARTVLEEDPDLYFAIQRYNPFRGEVYAALTAAVGEVTGAVERNDCEAFNQLLSRAGATLPRIG